MAPPVSRRKRGLEQRESEGLVTGAAATTTMTTKTTMAGGYNDYDYADNNNTASSSQLKESKRRSSRRLYSSVDDAPSYERKMGEPSSSSTSPLYAADSSRMVDEERGVDLTAPSSSSSSSSREKERRSLERDTRDSQLQLQPSSSGSSSRSSSRAKIRSRSSSRGISGGQSRTSKFADQIPSAAAASTDTMQSLATYQSRTSSSFAPSLPPPSSPSPLSPRPSTGHSGPQSLPRLKTPTETLEDQPLEGQATAAATSATTTTTTTTSASTATAATAAAATTTIPQEEPPGDLSFHTAEGISSEEADTSGSAMADDGHGGSSQRDESGGRLRKPDMPSPGDSNQRRYLLHVLQQPVTGCAFGSNLLSRLALAPPLIIHMQAIDRAGREISIEEDLPFLVCHVHLSTDEGTPADMLSPTTSPRRSVGGDQSISASVSRPSLPGSSTTSDVPALTASTPPPTISQSVRMLYGTLVASPMQLHTLNDRPATMFIFPEISIRSRGRFRLNVSLMRVPLPSASPRTTTTLAITSTDPFNVVLSSDYVAPHITDLTRHFARQGVGLILPPGQAGE